MKFKTIIILFCFVIIPISLFSQESEVLERELKVTKAAICKGISDREPVDSDTVFPSDIERVFCFTKIEGATAPAKVIHIWKYNDKEMASVELSVGSSSWRTWSSKRILSSWTGQWMVEIQNEAGKTLKTLEFEIK
jgi:hypothetical protein